MRRMVKTLCVIGLITINCPAIADYTLDQRVRECDRLAAVPEDEDSRDKGVELKDLDAPAAYRTCSEALTVAPNDPQIHLQMGRAYQKMGQLADAKREYKASGLTVQNGFIRQLEKEEKETAKQAEISAKNTAALFGFIGQMLLSSMGGGNYGSGRGGDSVIEHQQKQQTYESPSLPESSPTPYIDGGVGVYSTDPNL